MTGPTIIRHLRRNLLGLVALSSGVGLAAAEPSVIIESFTAGNHEQTLRLLPDESPAGSSAPAVGERSYATIKLPISAQGLNFHITASSAANPQPARIQYRLEGWDEEWQDLEGTMWLAIRFVDENGNRISSVSLPRTGQSPGWSGIPETSEFQTTTATVTPPARTRQIQLLFNGGESRTTGSWLIKRLRILGSASSVQPPAVLLDEHFALGQDLPSQPPNWRKEGMNLNSAQVYPLGGDGTRYALAIIDTDFRTSGRWLGINDSRVRVEPQVPLQIELEEAFSIGSRGDYSSFYHKLPAGRYIFHAIPVNEFGVQAGTGVRLPVMLVAPYYASSWFWVLIAGGTAGGLIGVVRYSTKRRMQRKLELSEQRRVVEQERIRIAQDIHDDMGARLTQISLMSRQALSKSATDRSLNDNLIRIDRAAREVAITLDEIVWAVNPVHDTLEGLGNYLSQYVTEIVAETEIRCRLDIPTLLPPRFISSSTRHHLLLAVKEMLHNALKHSGARQVRAQLTFTDPVLKITISDNGGGFDAKCPTRGNGMINMRQRLEAVGGTCEVTSQLGQGTTITLTLALKELPAS